MLEVQVQSYAQEDLFYFSNVNKINRPLSESLDTYIFTTISIFGFVHLVLNEWLWASKTSLIDFSNLLFDILSISFEIEDLLSMESWAVVKKKVLS